MSGVVKNDITVYATAPNIYHGVMYTDKELMSFNKIRDFYKSLNVNFLGGLKDSFYQYDDMYDTIYHLNQKGQKKRTAQVIKLLKESHLNLH